MIDETEITETESSGQNLEDAWQSLFSGGATGTGEEELLRIASDYALQLSAAQIRALLRLELESIDLDKKGRKTEAEKIQHFVKGWIKYKRNNNSELFVMRALDAISLRRFIGENAFKIDIQK